MSTDVTASTTRIEREGGALAPDERRLVLGSPDEAAAVGRERWRGLELLVRIHSGMNGGCVEGTVQSGMLCARAISREDLEVIGEDD